MVKSTFAGCEPNGPVKTMFRDGKSTKSYSNRADQWGVNAYSTTPPVTTKSQWEMNVWVKPAPSVTELFRSIPAKSASAPSSNESRVQFTPNWPPPRIAAGFGLSLTGENGSVQLALPKAPPSCAPTYQPVQSILVGR